MLALGGVPRHGPSVDIDQPAPDEVMRETLREVLAAPLDTAVFLTGVGARHLLTAATRTGLIGPLLAALRSAQVVARGGKPRRVLREFAIPVAWTAAPAESRVIRDALLAESLTGRRILVQCAGASPSRRRGADARWCVVAWPAPAGWPRHAFSAPARQPSRRS